MARLTKKVKLGVPRFLVLVLVAAVCGIQYPLWVGKGSNATLLDLQDQLKTQKEKNAALELEISRLEGEADSLRQGSEALESRTREKLNMIRENEYLIRIAP